MKRDRSCCFFFVRNLNIPNTEKFIDKKKNTEITTKLTKTPVDVAKHNHRQTDERTISPADRQMVEFCFDFQRHWPGPHVFGPKKYAEMRHGRKCY